MQAICSVKTGEPLNITDSPINIRVMLNVTTDALLSTPTDESRLFSLASHPSSLLHDLTGRQRQLQCEVLYSSASIYMDLIVEETAVLLLSWLQVLFF
jgi:hypothetical protein